MSQEFLDAATNGDVSKVKTMLHSDPSLARAKDQNGVSVIMKATYYGKKEVVDALLESGVELDVFEAVANGQTERVLDLIAKDEEKGVVNYCLFAGAHDFSRPRRRADEISTIE